MRFVSDLPDPVDVPETPIDQLGLIMLGKFAEGGGWSSRNLMLELNEAATATRPATPWQRRSPGSATVV
jgi:hypothetical protein